jgi:hypothetical protein
MGAAVIFMQWDSYSGSGNDSPFFNQSPLTFTSRQERLHTLAEDDRLWLVSRSPGDGQYYFVAALAVAQRLRNPPGGDRAARFGEFAILADRERSLDLGCRFPPEALLRALTFETERPIRYGASIGQSLQTLRVLAPDDVNVLNAALAGIQKGRSPLQAGTHGLWTKCDGIFATYFLTNWMQRAEPLAFLLYDPPPTVRCGAPVFLHSDKNLRLVARFRDSHFVAGHKQTVEPAERIEERERVWRTYRLNTLNPPAKAEFDKFWNAQNGVRALFLMDTLTPVPTDVPFKLYGRALEWGYPMGVGYRHLSVPQSLLLLKLSQLPEGAHALFLQGILDAAEVKE